MIRDVCLGIMNIVFKVIGVIEISRISIVGRGERLVGVIGNGDVWRKGRGRRVNKGILEKEGGSSVLEIS